MAPRKEKAEKAKDDDASGMIMAYLRKENRPYSATDISANLHNKVTKTAAARILKDLHERKELEGRAAGKQIVYHVKQDVSDGTSADELATMSTEIDSLRTEILALRAREKTLKSSLATVSSTLSTADLQVAVSSLQAEKQELVHRLSPLRAGDVEPIGEEERRRVDQELKKWSSLAKARARIRREMWAIVRDGCPEGIPLDDFKESLGLEVDG